PQRVKPVGVDPARVQLILRHEVGKLESAEVSRHLVLTADRVLVANLPVGAGWRRSVVYRLLDQAQLPLVDAVELAERDPFTWHEPSEASEQLVRKRLLAIDRRDLLEELKHVLEIGRPEPLHPGRKIRQMSHGRLRRASQSFHVPLA